MSLNITSVTGINPISTQPLADPIGQIPMDVASIIFQNLKTELPSMALVCKSWKALADDDVFRKMIQPVQAFGAQEWQQYIGVDAGKEPLLPRCAYVDMENDDHVLTFIPEKVTIKNENGMVEELALDNLEVISQLVNCPKNGHKTGFNFTDGILIKENRIERIRNKNRTQEKPHWVLIDKNVKGLCKSYRNQEKIAKEAYGNIPGIMEIVIAIFMDYVRSGKSNFELHERWSHQIRCKESKQDNIVLSFYQSKNELHVIHCLVDCFFQNVGFLLAKKFYGIY